MDVRDKWVLAVAQELNVVLDYAGVVVVEWVQMNVHFPELVHP